MQRAIIYTIPLRALSLAEQQRTVVKLDELIRLCDALEVRLTVAETSGAQPLDATLSQLLTNQGHESSLRSHLRPD